METCPKCGCDLKPSKVSRETFESIVDYLNRKTGRSFKSTTPATRRLIRARFAEGFTEENFLTVIDNQVRKWRSDPNMMDYLRPQTLFSPKFESYLQNGKPQKPRAKEKTITNYEKVQKAFETLSQTGDMNNFAAFCVENKLSDYDQRCVLSRYQISKGQFLFNET